MSIQIWGIACATVVQLVGAAVVAGLVLAREQVQGSQNMKMLAGGMVGMEEEKKEL